MNSADQSGVIDSIDAMREEVQTLQKRVSDINEKMYEYEQNKVYNTIYLLFHLLSYIYILRRYHE